MPSARLQHFLLFCTTNFILTELHYNCIVKYVSCFLQSWTLAQDSTLQLLQVFTQTFPPIVSSDLNASNTLFQVL